MKHVGGSTGDGLLMTSQDLGQRLPIVDMRNDELQEHSAKEDLE